jgi:hypothetical protein
MKENGQFYGEIMKDALMENLKLTIDTYAHVWNGYDGLLGINIITDNKYNVGLVAVGQQLIARFSSKYKHFLHGIAIGASMKYNDVLIVNAMATLPSIKPQFGCMFGFIPGLVIF